MPRYDEKTLGVRARARGRGPAPGAAHLRSRTLSTSRLIAFRCAPHTPPQIKDFEAKFAAEMASKEEAEKATAQKLKDEAEQWLDSWHDKKTDEKVEKAATNRKDEAEKSENMEALQEAAKNDNPFKRVYELIGAKEKGEDEETARMYGLVVSLKSHGAKALQK